MEREASDTEPDVTRPKPTIKQRCCSLGLGWKTLAWLVVMMAYLLFGGLIFMLAERPNEIDSVNAVVAEREDLARLLEEGTGAVMTALMASNSTLSPAEASELIQRVVNISSSLALASQELQAETSPLWTFSPSVLFAATVVTTIGYGNTAPVTGAGRTLFIFYALIGIPICLVFLSFVGELLSNYINTVTRRVSERTKSRSRTRQAVIQVVTIASLLLTGLVIFIIIPSAVFYSIEPWTYGEAVYFCFVTLTTVGFGDFVPAQRSNSSLLSFYRICSAAWVLVGLAWLALLLTRIQNTLKKIGPYVRSKARKVKEKRKERRQGCQLETPATAAPGEDESREVN